MSGLPFSFNFGRGNRAHGVRVGDVTLYFSYETIIAFEAPGYGLVVSENVWSMTTGRHLNAINPNKSIRLPRAKFEKLLDEVLEKYHLRGNY